MHVGRSVSLPLSQRAMSTDEEDHLALVPLMQTLPDGYRYAWGDGIRVLP